VTCSTRWGRLTKTFGQWRNRLYTCFHGL